MVQREYEVAVGPDCGRQLLEPLEIRLERIQNRGGSHADQQTRRFLSRKLQRKTCMQVGLAQTKRVKHLSSMFGGEQWPEGGSRLRDGDSVVAVHIENLDIDQTDAGQLT